MASVDTKKKSIWERIKHPVKIFLKGNLKNAKKLQVGTS